MGVFAVLISLIIVVIQSTSILVGRDAHKWTFPLLKTSPNTSYLKQINMLFSNSHSVVNATHLLDLKMAYHDDFSNSLIKTIAPQGSENKSHNNSLSPSLNNADNTIILRDMNINVFLFNKTTSSRGQAACLQTAWKESSKSSFPVYCLLNSHLRQEIKSIMKDFNPHLLLLTLCTVHSIFCIAKLKKVVSSTINNKNSGAHQNIQLNIEHPHTISLSVSAFVLILFLVIIYIIEGTKQASLVEYPTIIITIILIIASIYFVIFSAYYKENRVWFNLFHLLFVSVPTAVLSMAIVGTRFWTDIVSHALLLIVAANVFIISNYCQDVISKKICQMIYVFLPIFCVYAANLQWGTFDNWKYVIGIMGCTSLIPLIIYPFFIEGSHKYTEHEPNSKEMKYFAKLTLLASSAALLSLVVNLAMFYEA
jgi:hypothetical protein